MKKLLGTLSDKTKTLSKKLLSVKLLLILAIFVAALTGAVYGYSRYNTAERRAERVFWGAVDNSLKTSSFSRSSSTKNGGQSSSQVVDVETSPKRSVYSQTHYVQTGLDEASATTENIGTAYADYVRYVSIITSQRTPDGKPYDFSRIVNVWGGAPSDGKNTNGQQFGQSVLASLPIGSLTAAQRAKLIEMMKKEEAYAFSVTKVTREGLTRRPSFTYSAKLRPAAYITVLKQFGEYMGLTQLEPLNPEDYEGARETGFQVTIDGWSHQVTSMTQQSTGRTETFNGYGARKTQPVAPTNYISVDELQARLQSVE